MTWNLSILMDFEVINIHAGEVRRKALFVWKDLLWSSDMSLCSSWCISPIIHSNIHCFLLQNVKVTKLWNDIHKSHPVQQQPQTLLYGLLSGLYPATIETSIPFLVLENTYSAMQEPSPQHNRRDFVWRKYIERYWDIMVQCVWERVMERLSKAE